MPFRCLAPLVLVAALTGCKAPTSSPQPSPPTATPAAIAPPTEAKEATQATATVPEAVKQFDAFCYRTNADFGQIERLAKAMNLQDAPPDLMELMSSGRGDEGKAFVIELDRTIPRVMIVGAGKNGTCSIYAGGYDSDAIESSLKSQFQLLKVAEDSVGLQTMTMHIPGGTSNRLSETHEKGLVSILRSKPETGNGEEIMIAFVSPEVAKATFQ